MSTLMALLTPKEFNDTCKLLQNYDPKKYNIMTLSWSDKGGYKISHLKSSNSLAGHIATNIFTGWSADITLTYERFEREVITEFFIINKEEAKKHPEILAKFKEFLSQNENDFAKLVRAGLYEPPPPPTPPPGGEKLKAE